MRQHKAAMHIEELRMRSLRPDEVLVRMAAAGVCHTDYEAWTGTYPTALPTVLGHEGAGVIEDVGTGVRGLRAGDHVVCSIYPNCGTCFYCRRTLPMLCEGMSAAEATPFSTRSDAPVSQFLRVSSFADYCIVPASGAVRIPDAMPLDRACLLGCAVITGVGSVLRIARVQQGETVAVIGCGAVGLNVIQGARIAGASTIIAIDTNLAKLEKARSYGATHQLVVGDGQPSIPDAVRDLTQGRGVDHSFEAAGIVNSLELALLCSRPGATVTVLGKTAAESQIAIRFGALVGERRIRRSSLGGAQAQDDFPFYARAYLEGKLELDDQIDHRVRMDAIDVAMQAIEKGEVIRTVVVMEDALQQGKLP